MPRKEHVEYVKCLPKQRFENIAFLADDHFLNFACILGALAPGSANIPAHMAAIEFPCWTLLLVGAILSVPTGDDFLFSCLLVNEEEVEVFLGVLGNIAPALFVTVHGTYRHPEELSKLFLCFTKLSAGKIEFILSHSLSRL